MRTFYTFVVGALLALPTMTMAAINIDGVADAAYGSAIVTQQFGTTVAAGDNTDGLQGPANGSEMDTAYGFVSNGVLYVVFTGNIDSGGINADGNNPFDKLHVFLMTGPGGDHTLGNGYNGAADFGRLNRMGVNGGGAAPGNLGLTFDTGFSPNYWLGMTVGNVGDNPTFYLNYEVVCSNCFGAFLGSVTASNTPPNNVFLDGTFGILAAINNSNVLGVDASGCFLAGSGATNSTLAATVTTGVELAVPLSAIGSPTGQVSVCAFLTTDPYDTMYNQILPSPTGTVADCLANQGDPSALDLNTLPGKHFFTLPVPPCNAMMVNPTTASYTSTGGVGSVAAANSGGCAITVTASTNWLSITSTPGLGSGIGSFTYSVAPNTNSIQTRTGQFILSSTAGSGFIVTQIVTITQSGIPSPPLSSVFTLDGIAEAAYGCPLTVQQIQTGFGNVTTTNANLLITGNGGSELDAAYGMIENGNLFLVFAGNLENNGNKLDIFLMTGPGGQNTLSNANPNVGNLNNMATSTNGLTFHTGFAPNYLLSANVSAGTFFIDYAQLVQGGTNSGAIGNFLGRTTITNGTLIGGTNPFGIQATVNNSNTNGVDGANPGCLTNGASQVEADLAAPVRKGIELGIPLSALGSPTGAIAVVAFVNSGAQTFMSNQMLPALVTNACQGNLGNPLTVNLNSFAGEASFLVGPEMRVTSISRVATNILISFQTAVNTNLAYQVQRTSALTTNTTWATASALTNGTGQITTLTIVNGATNNPAQFYRVRQTTLCP